MSADTTHPRGLSATAAQRRLLLLSATRWFPVGLVFGLTTLLPLERGLSLTEVGLMLSAQGLVVLALELPTGGLADSWGRRPTLVVASVVAVGSGVLFLTAHSFFAFFVAMALQGVYRALDSGPLEAWYVDTAQADDPEVGVEQALSRAATVIGVAIAVGALVSGGLVAWDPWSGVSALVLPYTVAITLQVAHAVATIVLVREPLRSPSPLTGRLAGLRSVARSAREVPQLIRDGVRTLRTAPVLRSLVLVEVFWSVGMIAFETLNPARLAELVGGEERAGALYGPASAAAWGLFAVGSMLAGLASRRIGVGWTALVARVLNGCFIVAMGLAAGPVGLIAAYWLTYLTHGAAGPVHNTLLHRQATAANRATVLSMNSMVGGACYSLGLLVLGPLAEYTSTATAMVVAGAFSLLGAVLYLPAIRVEKSAPVQDEPVP